MNDFTLSQLVCHITLPDNPNLYLNGQGDFTSPSAGASIPTGALFCWPVASAPAGYLLCDGAAVSRATYSDLFALIGTTYGAGDGATTFNLPNLKGRAPAGLDAGQTEFDSLGETGGAKTHTLITGEIPAHSHAVTDPGHNHTQDAHNHTQNAHNHIQDAHNHTQNAHNHTQASTTVSTGSASNRLGTVDTSSTAQNTGDATATNQAATATNQNATATNQAATATNQSNVTGISNQNAGGSGAHNNLQPYLVLNFIIKT